MSKRDALLTAVFISVVLGVPTADTLADPQTFHIVVVNEVYSNDDGTKQYVELRAKSLGQTQLQFSRVTARSADGTMTTLLFDFTAVFGWGDEETLLLATATMAAELPTPPDFIIPDASVPFPSGRIVFEQDPPTVNIVDAVSYGNYTGSNTGYGTPAVALPTNGCQSLLNVAQVSPPGVRNNSTNWGVGLPSPQPNDDLPGSVSASCPASPPELAPVGSKVVNENQLLQFDVSATDINGDAITLIAEGLPTGATFNTLTSTSKRFSWTPTFLQSGIHNVLFIASAGADADSENVQITVNNTNRAPVLAALGPRNVNEGANLNFNVPASDPDLTNPTLTAQDVPANATFVDNGNGTGTFNFNPNFTQADVFNVLFIASDGALADSELVAITVANVNQAPVLASIGPRNVNEGTNLNFNVSATDGDGTTPTLTAENVPSNATFVDDANGTGTFNFNPDFTQAGVFNVRFITSDGALADTEVVAITANEVTDPPDARDSAASTEEDVAVGVILQAFDPDGDPIPRTIVSGPFHSVLQVVNALTGDYTYTPTLNYNGSDSVLFSVNDGFVNSNTAVLRLTTTPVNDAPVAQNVNAGTLVNTPTTVPPMPITDVDNTVDGTITHDSGPFHGSVSNFDPTTGSFDYTPNLDYEGGDTITYIATDINGAADTAKIFLAIGSGCACDCDADPSNCDGVQDITDVVQTINVSFRGAASILDPNAACPYETTDTNCSNSTDVIDVVKMVNVAFRGANVATEFCDPCP